MYIKIWPATGGACRVWAPPLASVLRQDGPRSREDSKRSLLSPANQSELASGCEKPAGAAGRQNARSHGELPRWIGGRVVRYALLVSETSVIHDAGALSMGVLRKKMRRRQITDLVG
jgi:hypothetical protein